MSDPLYQSVGGRLVTPARRLYGSGAPEPYWNFGWVPPEERTEEQHDAHDRATSAMPAFAVRGRSQGDVKRADLTELWKHADVVSALGHPYTGTHQLTGSCVGAGGGNVAASVSYVDAVRLGDLEKCILPFYPYTYGRSRFRCGMNGRGEGSLGSGWAEAAKKDGVLDNLSHPELHRPANSDGLVWGASVEMEWSAGDRAPCTAWLDRGVKHPIRTVSRARNASDVRQGLINLFPATCASMYGFTARVHKGVLLGTKGPRWAHQMSLQAFWDHPELGPLYWLHNQWGLEFHGRCPTGMPGGGAWITEVDVDWICRDEVFIFSQYDGYPVPDFDIPWVFRAAPKAAAARPRKKAS